MNDERASERESRHYKTTLACDSHNVVVDSHNVLYFALPHVCARQDVGLTRAHRLRVLRAFTSAAQHARPLPIDCRHLAASVAINNKIMESSPREPVDCALDGEVVDGRDDCGVARRVAERDDLEVGVHLCDLAQPLHARAARVERVERLGERTQASEGESTASHVKPMAQ